MCERTLSVELSAAVATPLCNPDQERLRAFLLALADFLSNVGELTVPEDVTVLHFEPEPAAMFRFCLRWNQCPCPDMLDRFLLEIQGFVRGWLCAALLSQNCGLEYADIVAGSVVCLHEGLDPDAVEDLAHILG